MYDIKKDPHCIKNLAPLETAKKIREDLHQRLIRELKRTGDPRTWAKVPFEFSPFTDPIQRKRNLGKQNKPK